MKQDEIISVILKCKEKGIRILVLDLYEGKPGEETSGTEKIRFLVSPEEKKLLYELAGEAGWRKIEAPGKEGYLYGVERFVRYSYGSLELEFCFQIACRSTLNASWVPLDRCINRGALDRAVEEDGIPLLAPEDRVPYLLANCMYTKKAFSDNDRRLIEEARKKADDKLMREKTGMVFFRFTERLFSLMDQGKYDGLIDALWRFAEY